MGFCVQFTALLKKNVILWHRNLCGSLCELIFPVALMFIIVAVRKVVQNENFAEQSYVSRPGLAYHMDETLKVGHNYSNDANPLKLGLNPGSPFVACMHYKRPVIAFVGTHPIYDKIRTHLFSSTGGKHWQRSRSLCGSEGLLPASDFRR